MPYITVDRRQHLAAFGIGGVASVGELNFWITTRYLIPWILEAPSYSRMQAIRGRRDALTEELNAVHVLPFSTREIQETFDVAYLEFYRRIAGPYEDVKATENGDVYAEALKQMGLYGKSKGDPHAV